MAVRKTIRECYDLRKRIQEISEERDVECNFGMLENGRAEFRSGPIQEGSVAVRREGWG